MTDVTIPSPGESITEVRIGAWKRNDGDWVEGCTALVEHFDGRMELLHWADEIAARAKARPVAKIEMMAA
jgi:hypothetical protein